MRVRLQVTILAGYLAQNFYSFLAKNYHLTHPVAL